MERRSGSEAENGATVSVNPPGQILGRSRSKRLLNLWNHIASSHDEDFIPDVDAETVHLSHVVERGVLNGHAAPRWGAMRATGVMFPVRPVCHSTSMRTEYASSGGNFHASAHLG